MSSDPSCIKYTNCSTPWCNLKLDHDLNSKPEASASRSICVGEHRVCRVSIYFVVLIGLAKHKLTFSTPYERNHAQYNSKNNAPAQHFHLLLKT